VAYQRSAKAVPIALKCGIAVGPDTFLVKADEYPLSRRLYLYSHPSRALSPETAAFLTFAQTAEGQGVVARSGAVDLLPAQSDPDYANARRNTAGNSLDGGRTRIRMNDLRALNEATSGAARLSITFRFQPGSDALDNRAVADLRRLAETLRSPAFAKARVTLIGFSQAMGDYEGNRELSRDRAEAVRKRLTEAGGMTDIAAIGVGPAAPVTCNDNTDTARMNQRVEVWVRRPPGS
jgi:phosphate transport system substrate-binding protein